MVYQLCGAILTTALTTCLLVCYAYSKCALWKAGVTLVMYSAIDINGEGMQPKEDNYPILSSLFFILHILHTQHGDWCDHRTVCQMSGWGMLTE